jgi:hypothetical protein
VRKLLFGLFIVMFASVVNAQVKQPPAEFVSDIRFFAIDADLAESDARSSIAKQIRADLKEHGKNTPLLAAKSWWYYDCKQGRIIQFDPFKKNIAIMVDPMENDAESQLIRLEKSDFQKLGIDLDAVRKVHYLLYAKSGLSFQSPPFALRATKVLTYEEVHKLIEE